MTALDPTDSVDAPAPSDQPANPDEAGPIAGNAGADIEAWMSFLATQPLDETDRVTIAAAVAEEGPLAELSAIEARRVMRQLDRSDDVARAHAWSYLRTTIHRAEQVTGMAKRALAVVHRHDPVLLPVRVGLPIITERCIADWAVLRTVVVGLATPEAEIPALQPFEADTVRSAVLTPVASDLAVLELRRRVGHAPIARAAIADLMRRGHDVERIRLSLQGLDITDIDRIDRQIIRLWTVAELRRLDRTLRPVADATEETEETAPGPRTVDDTRGVPGT